MVLPSLSRGSGRYGGVTLLPSRFFAISDVLERFPTLGAAQAELRRIGQATRRSTIVAVRRELSGQTDKQPQLNQIRPGFRPTAETITQSQRKFGKRYRYSFRAEVTDSRTGLKGMLDVMFDDDRLLSTTEARAEAESISENGRREYGLTLDRLDYTGISQSVDWLGEPVR